MVIFFLKYVYETIIFRYVGMSDEEHRIQMSIYKAIREGGKLEGGVVDEDEEAVDGDYVKATSGNR